MPRNVMVLTNPIVKVASSQAGLAAGTAYQCQIMSAVITIDPVFNTIPPTGCAGPAQSPGNPAYGLDLQWLQDWTAAGGGGLSGWAWQNKNTPQWVSITPDSAAPTVKAEGQVYVVPGQFGGTFGDGSAAPATATWPFINPPTITPATLEADAETVPADAETVAA